MLSDGRFSLADLKSMELDLLVVLRWHLHPPTFHAFIALLLEFLDASLDRGLVEDYAFRLAEQTRKHYDFVKYPPSMIAVASILCALKLLQVEAHCVTQFMRRVHECNFRYTHRADAAAVVTECGLKLIQLNGRHASLLCSSVACDAEVESATAASEDVAAMDVRGAAASKAVSDKERKQAGTPTDVMDIDEIEKYGT